MATNDNFVFYSSWLETIEAFEQNGNTALAKDIALQIIKFGVHGEINSDDPVVVGIVNGMCRDLITKAKNRRRASVEGGTMGGRPVKYSREEMMALREQGLSDQDIADNLGCNVRTVQRALDDE